MVGDQVRLTPGQKGKGVIEELLPRKNKILRPPIANVDIIIITFSFREPEPNLVLLDRMLVQAFFAGIESMICFNKADLGWEERGQDIITYSNAGYKVFVTSAVDGTGLEDLRQILKGAVTVFAGSSGVGKSSLINALYPGADLKTGEVSRKLERGKHTTRHVELIPLPENGLVADTPGFSRLKIPPVKREELACGFSEFEQYSRNCRFKSCLHFREPHCAVKIAVDEGKVNPGRYRNYIYFLHEIMDLERRSFND